MNKKTKKTQFSLAKEKSKTRESEIFILEKCFEVFHESWNSSSYVLENVKVYKVFHMKSSESHVFQIKFNQKTNPKYKNI